MPLFGRSPAPAPAPTAAQQATASVQALRAHITRMDKREREVEKKRNAEHQLALKKTKAKDKRGAMMCLKKKKLYDKELEQLMQTKFSLEQQMQMLEQSVMQAQTVQAMQQASRVQAKQLKEIGGSEGVEDVLDDVRETMEEAQEIGDVLAMGFSGDVDVMDDAELLGDLAGLEEEMLDEQLADLGPVPQGGAAQVAAPVAAPAPATAEEDEMAELQAMMAA